MSVEVKSSTIGIQEFTVFPYDQATQTYGAPVALTTLKSIDVSVKVIEHKEYNDNSLFESITQFSDAEISCEFTSLSLKEQALLLGWKNEGAVQYLSTNDVSGSFAVAYKRTKANNNNKYVKFLNCTTKMDNTSGKTKSDSIEVQPDKIVFTAKPLPTNFAIVKFRNVVKLEVDSSDGDYNDEGDAWFTTALPVDLNQDNTVKKNSRNTVNKKTDKNDGGITDEI